MAPGGRRPERTHPILTFPDHDEATAFYEALGFRRTYRQLRPNPYAVVGFEDIIVHLSGIQGFDPTTSLGSVAVVVPDAEVAYPARTRRRGSHRPSISTGRSDGGRRGRSGR